MARSQKDALLKAIKALPAAGAANYSDGIDLGQVTAFPVNEAVDVLLTVPAVPALVDAKTIIYTFKDSADNVTFAAIPELATITSTGAGGAGAAAVAARVKLPPSTKRYIRADASVLAAGGDNTAVSYVLELAF